MKLDTKKLIIFFFIFYLISALSGCSKSTVSSPDVSSDRFQGYENANYEELNSPAEKNGLDGKKVYISGRTGEMKLINGVVFMVLTDENNHQWLLSWGLEEELQLLNVKYFENNNITSCGTYIGFSEKTKMPALQIEKVFSKGRDREIEELAATPSPTATSTPYRSSIQLTINWNKCAQEWEAALTDKTNSFVKSMNAQVNENTKMITLSAAVTDSTSNETALDFADTMIRQFNLYAQMQDNSIESASKDYYGGIYDEYSVYVGVAPLSQIDNQKQWYVNSVVTKGMHTRQAPKLNN